MVLVSRKNKKMILEYLFKEGVLTVKKDGMYKEKHDDIEVPNLHVMMVMKSLASKDYVKFKFNWRWFYYYLTDAGIEYLREVLHLPAQVFPATLTKQTRPQRTTADPSDRYNDEEGGKGKGKKGKGKGKKGKGKGKKGGWKGGKSYGEGYDGAKDEADYAAAEAGGGDYVQYNEAQAE